MEESKRVSGRGKSKSESPCRRNMVHLRNRNCPQWLGESDRGRQWGDMRSERQEDEARRAQAV